MGFTTIELLHPFVTPPARRCHVHPPSPPPRYQRAELDRYNWEKEELRSTKARLLVVEDEQHQLKWEYEVAALRFDEVKSQRDKLAEKFQATVYETQQKSGFRNVSVVEGCTLLMLVPVGIRRQSNAIQSILDGVEIRRSSSCHQHTRAHAPTRTPHPFARSNAHAQAYNSHVHATTYLLQLILEKKYSSLQEVLQAKEAQLNEVLARANLESGSAGTMRTKVDDLLQKKNQAVLDLQAEVERVVAAHNQLTMVVKVGHWVSTHTLPYPAGCTQRHNSRRHKQQQRRATPSTQYPVPDNTRAWPPHSPPICSRR